MSTGLKTCILNFSKLICLYLPSFGSSSIYMYSMSSLQEIVFFLVLSNIYTHTHTDTLSRSYFGVGVIYAQFHLFLFISILSCLSLYVLFLAACLHSVKPWPPARESPYGPTAGLFSFFLSFCLCLCVCVCTCMFSLLSVFPHCQQPSFWLCLPLSVALLWDQLLVFE